MGILDPGEMVEFGTALQLMKGRNRLRMRRTDWTEGTFITVVPVGDLNMITEPFIMFRELIPQGTCEGCGAALQNLTPWAPSHSDLLADDWMEYQPPTAEAKP